MEQMYLIEIFIDKLSIFISDEDNKSGADKNLIIKVNFGPKVRFIINEGKLVKEDRPEDIVSCDDQGRQNFTRRIRIGKSYMFPSYPDTILLMLEKFPLEIEVWNDDEKEVNIFVGIGIMAWDKEFYQMLKENDDPKKVNEPLAIKQTVLLWAECCCKPAGTITFFLRLAALGDGVITEFQQLMTDSNEAFVFRTNRAPSMFHSKRIEGDDPNFIMVGTLYESTTLEDPEVVENAEQKIEVCTEQQSCGMLGKIDDYSCEHPTDEKKPKKKKYPIDRIRMGDIAGPCGNANCALTHKVKNYIRALESYKRETKGAALTPKDDNKKICGACCCKDGRYHRDTCPNKQGKTSCRGCGGMTDPGGTCDDKKMKLTQDQSEDQSKDKSKDKNKDKNRDKSKDKNKDQTQVNYVLSVTKVSNFKESIFGRQFIADNLNPQMILCQSGKPSETGHMGTQHTVCNVNSTTNLSEPKHKVSSRSFGTKDVNLIYNASVDNKHHVFYANRPSHPSTSSHMEPGNEDDCTCNPPKPTPTCKTFDCDCISEIVNTTARKNHKSYCPLYKHKPNCPVTMSLEEENLEEVEVVEDKTEPLPYGLPPIRLGPCPVLGRPCTVPDGFMRMYRNAVQPPLPPSHSDAGKVCCSAEYWRIKNAMKEYLTNHKEDDIRCLNRFNVDTERRCCDKEQALFELMGRGCCGQHKLSIQDKYKQDK